jgi:hypothetical protein
VLVWPRLASPQHRRDNVAEDRKQEHPRSKAEEDGRADLAATERTQSRSLLRREDSLDQQQCVTDYVEKIEDRADYVEWHCAST